MVVLPKYENLKVSQSSLAVVLHGRTIVNYKGNVEPEFGPGNPDSLIMGYFKSAVVKGMGEKTEFSPVIFIDEAVVPGIMSREVSLKMPNGSNKVISTPGFNTCFQFESRNPAFVLVIDRLYIGTELKTTTYWADGTKPRPDTPESMLQVERTLYFPGTGYAFSSVNNYSPPVFTPTPIPMMHASTTKSLIYDADISLWNNEAKDLVAYGHIRSKVSSSFIPVVTMGTWNQVTSGFVNALFGGTPFSRITE